jgi:iron complex outermembrane receptor protein
VYLLRSPSFLLAAAAAASLNVRPAAGQDTLTRPLARQLPPVVTVTRDVRRSPLDLPYSISTLRPDSVNPGQTHTSVDQTLSLLPGVTVSNRTNPSQDTRISIRGFGARSQFGARSIRILRDGIPLTLPDGQTPIDYLDLESVGQVEAIRGAASSLYGHASGGVIDLRSADPPAVPLAGQLRSFTGANGLRRYTGLFGGTSGGVSYLGNIGHTENDGYREYSRQKLTNAFLRGTASIGQTQIALIGMGLDMPLAQNPGALTRAQVDTDPEQADAPSVAKRARKEVHQVQVGLSATRPLLSSGEIHGQVYGGTRSLANPLTFAIVGIDRKQGGAGVRITVPIGPRRVDNRLSIGADAQWLNDARKNWANCNGLSAPTAACPVLAPGVEKGSLSLDQRELVSSIGPYVRDELRIGIVRATAGIRADQVRFELQDHFLADGFDDSGTRTLRAVSPMVGLAARLTPVHSVYATVGSAFETPTTTELGNQADGSAGLNADLKPQYSTTYEVGAKGLALSRIQYDVALFETEVRDELIPFEVTGGAGRTYFRNAGRTRRRGAEIQLATDVGPLSVVSTYTHSHFRFRDFSNGGVQFAGNAIPGIPENQLQTAATLRLARAYMVAELQTKSRVQVNDANAPGAYARGFEILNLRAGGTAVFGKPWLAPVIGVQNVFDRRYVGSVAINASGASIAATKFYEPAPRRTWYIGLSAATAPW